MKTKKSAKLLIPQTSRGRRLDVAIPLPVVRVPRARKTKVRQGDFCYEEALLTPTEKILNGLDKSLESFDKAIESLEKKLSVLK
jgi:hypothetical protein